MFLEGAVVSTARAAAPLATLPRFVIPTPPIATSAAVVNSPTLTPIILPTIPPATPEPVVASPAPTTAIPLPPTAVSPSSYEAPQPAATLPAPRATLPPELGYQGPLGTVLFSPGGVEELAYGGDLIVNSLIEYIDAAQSTIYLAVYEMNLTPIAEALIRAHQRGVDVRFVTDNEGGIEADADEGHGQFAMMAAAGIPIRPDTRSALMHNKFIVIDGAIAMTGSMNLTSNDVYRNNNNAVVLYAPEVAAIYTREFEEMWNGQFGPTSPAQSGQAVFDLGGQPFVVLFAPEDDPFDTLVQLVSVAQDSIRFMAFSFTNDALGLAMLERAQAGVDVRGIFEVRGSETEYAEMPRLYCAGVPVRQDGNSATFHHKVVIIDNYVVITGSMNFSDSAAESNDENMVAISQPELARQYLLEFERRWAEATDPLPEDMNCP